MRSATLLLGEAADFQPVSDNAPAWDHQLLIRDLGARPLAIDALRSQRGRRLLSIKDFDLGQLVRLAVRMRAAGRILAQSEQSGYVAALAQTISGGRTPLFIIFHGQRWWTRRNRFLARVARRLSHVRFLCLASSLASVLTDELNIPPDRVLVTGFGADAAFFRPESDHEHGLVVAAGTASRDYRTLVKAVDGLLCQVEIAADSTWYREALNVDPTAVPSNVILSSAGGYPKLRDLYARAQFVVVPLVPSRYAAGYAVIAEAMAMGKAVIATRTDAPSDLIEDGVSGLYVPPGDPAALRSAIQRLTTEPSLVQAMGRAARAAVERAWNVEAYAARLAAALEAR